MQIIKQGLEVLKESNIYDVYEKIENGEELTKKDGYTLIKEGDLISLGIIADSLRKRSCGDEVTFVLNRHINYTNICVSKCKFCAFYKDKEDGYTLSIEDVLKKVDESIKLGITELHIVGALNPDIEFEYYEEMIKRIKEKYPNIQIKAFSAVEIDFFAKIYRMSYKEILERLKNAGLDFLPGGGAEILDDKLREELCPNKANSEAWLKVMETAHNLGIKTNATMLYGHVEKPEQRIDHIFKIINLQKKTHGFLAFIPLSFHPKNTELEEIVKHEVGGVEDLKVIAISRILLDKHIRNIRAYWVMLGKKLTQVALLYGANDIDGTVIEENVFHSAGAKERYMPVNELIRLIKEAGRIPVQRTTDYKVIRRFV